MAEDVDDLRVVQRARALELLGLLEDILTPMQRDLLSIRFGLNDGASPCKPDLDSVATHYGVTKERIRQIEHKALRNLQKAAK